MLFNGPITDAVKQAASTRLPQAIFVGGSDDLLKFAHWNALHRYDHISVISVIAKGSLEEAQLDAVVAEKGIVPRLHIIPPTGRGLTPTCLFKEGLKEDIISQALATAGGIMMSYTDVMESITRQYIAEEVRNASKETSRALATGRATASSPVNLSSASSPVSLASPNSASAACTAVPSSVSSPSGVNKNNTNNNNHNGSGTVLSSSATAPSTTGPPAHNTNNNISNNTGNNVKVVLKVVSDGKSHTVYTSNLWNAAAQLAKGHSAPAFYLEVGRSDNTHKATKAEEVRTLPLTEGTIVRLVFESTASSSPSSSTSLSLRPPSSLSATVEQQHHKAMASTAAAAAAPTSSSPSQAGGGSVEIRFTLPTGSVHQLAFAPSDTLAHVRQQVSEKLLHDNAEMGQYCAANGLSSTEFTLAVAYPPKRLENTEEVNKKTIAELNLGSKFALRVVMAFLPGGGAGGAAASAGGQPPRGTITGNVGSVFGSLGGWLRGNGNDPQ